MQTLVGNLCSPKPWGGQFSAGRCRPTTGLHARQSRPSARRVPGIVPGTGYPGSTSPSSATRGIPRVPTPPSCPGAENPPPAADSSAFAWSPRMITNDQARWPRPSGRPSAQRWPCAGA